MNESIDANLEAREPSQRDAWTDSLVPLAELLAVVGGTILATVLLSLPFVLVREIEMPLVVAGNGSEELSTDELIRRVDETAVAESAEIRTGDGDQRLVFLESESGSVREVFGVLREAGYSTGTFQTRTRIRPDSVSKQAAPWLMGVQAFVFLLFGGIMIRLRVERRPAPTNRRRLLAVPIGFVLGACVFAFSGVISLLLDSLGLEVVEQAWVLELLRERETLIRVSPWMVVIVPLSEELFFRGYALRFLAQRQGALMGLLVSSLGFALVHFNPSGFVIYLGIGLALGWVYLRTSTLVAPMVAHITHNGAVLLLALHYAD